MWQFWVQAVADECHKGLRSFYLFILPSSEQAFFFSFLGFCPHGCKMVASVPDITTSHNHVQDKQEGERGKKVSYVRRQCFPFPQQACPLYLIGSFPTRVVRNLVFHHLVLKLGKKKNSNLMAVESQQTLSATPATD